MRSLGSVTREGAGASIDGSLGAADDGFSTVGEAQLFPIRILHAQDPTREQKPRNGTGPMLQRIYQLAAYKAERTPNPIARIVDQSIKREHGRRLSSGQRGKAAQGR